jgi:HK97 family phage major capsid protein/HK97 family phage prohead protease
MQRAYSILTVKAVEDEQRIIRGTATTPAPDRMGDVVEPLGVTFKNPLPLLHQHDSRSPVGTVKFDKPTKNGITFEARLPKIEEPGSLKDRVDTAWGEVKAGLVRAVSIGFRAIEHAFMDDGGIRFLQSEVLELSLVTVPANADAMISTIKSIDAPLLAATGKEPKAADRPLPPGVTGKSPTKPVNLRPKEAKTMSKTIQEQIAALEAKRAATAARMSEIMQKSVDDGRTTDAAEQEEFDNLQAELDPIDADLKRFKALEKAQVATAKPVVADIKTVEQGNEARGGYRAPVSIRTNQEKGTGFIRLIASKWLSHQLHRPAADIAKERFGDTPDVEAVLRSGFDATNIAEAMYQRTAVVAGNTTDSAWAGPLVVAQNLASEFFEMLRASTIIGRIPNLRRVPFNISVPRALTDPIGYWVGQGDVKPVSSMTFDSVTLPFHKVAGIVPITEELARFSNPSAEGIIRSALVGALTYRVDRDFLDPSVAVVGVVNPASVTNGVTPTVATGTTADAFRADLGTMIATYLGLNMSPAGLVLVMTSTQAMKLGLMRNTLGQKEFPDIGILGGSIEGIPVITSENIVATGGSPTDGYPIIAINAPEVMIADDGGVSIDVSREASLQMNDAPDSPETTSTILVSLWQRNYVAFKAERFITWKKGRTGAVQFISSAKYSE